MITDPHDPRTFRRWLSFNPDGSVAASHDLAAGVEPMTPLVEVTDLVPADFHAIQIDPTLIAALDDAAVKLATAKTVHAEAKAELGAAVATAVTAQKAPSIE